MSEIDPLPDDLRDLLAPEKRLPSAPGKERVRARLDATLFGPGGGGGPDGEAPKTPPAAPAAAGGALAKIAAAFLAGGIAGGALVATLREPRVEVRERVVTVTAEAAAPEAVSVPRVDHVEAPPPSVSAPSATTSAAAPAPAASDSLSAERALLDPARIALGKGDGANALAAVDRHAAKYPTGKLAEEREAIAVQALVRLGRKDEARARGARFLSRYPQSVLSPAVEAALDAGAP
jgi:hypothetical protein